MNGDKHTKQCMSDQEALAEWRERRLKKDREAIQLEMARQRNAAINRGLVEWIDSRTKRNKEDP